MLQQALPRRRQRYPALRALEQAHTHLALQIADLHRQRRLADVQPCRRAGEVELLCDGDEVAQMTQLH